MKKLKTFINCLGLRIKKYFFKEQISDISHACERLNEITDEVKAIEELKLTEEYATKYNRTTRWQTI